MTPSKLKTLLSIAGSDPMGGAGIQADIKTGTMMGLHVVTAVTAVTVQNSNGLMDLGAVSPDSLKAQLMAIMEDVIPDAIKLGMIGSVENLYIVAEFLKCLYNEIPIIIDPILNITANNAKAIEQNDIDTVANLYIDNLFEFASVITPNLKELTSLSGNSPLDLNDPLIFLNKLHSKAVIIKGGHSDKEMVEDLLITENGMSISRHKRVTCKNLHGTGCVFSSMIASFLAKGKNLEESFQLTSQNLSDIILSSCDYTLGDSSYGPLNINNYRL